MRTAETNGPLIDLYMDAGVIPRFFASDLVVYEAKKLNFSWLHVLKCAAFQRFSFWFITVN